MLSAASLTTALLVIIVVGLVIALTISFFTHRNSASAPPESADWKEYPEIYASLANWDLFRIVEPFSLRPTRLFLDQGGVTKFTVQFHGKRGRAVIRDDMGTELSAKRSRDSEMIEYYAGPRLVGTYTFPSTVLSGDPKYVTYEGRRIEAVHEASGIFIGPLDFLEGDILLAKSRPLSRSVFAPDALALKSETTLHLRMILCYVACARR